MKRGVWATLDLAPTTDRSAIRRAYATRLKAMDVDADPDGFAALRDARDAALAHAADPRPELQQEPVPEPLFEPEEPPPPPADPEVIALHDAIDAHFRALQALLFPGDDTPPGAEELAAIEHHGRALLADPRLEQVDFATDAERWFAEVLAAAIPRSDPLLEPAAATFGWIDRRDDYALLPDARAIVERIGATRFVALLADPKHRLHRAWGELTRTDSGRRGWRVGRGSVHDLLSIVRARYPAAEAWLNPDRVARWGAPPADGRGKGYRWWVVVILVVTLIRIVYGVLPDSAPPPKPDANHVAQAMTGQNLAQVRAVNPGLARAIERSVVDTTGRYGETPSATGIAQRLTDERIASGIVSPPGTLVRDMTRWDLDQMRNAQAENPASCPGVTLLTPGVAMPAAMAERHRALLRAAVLYTGDEPVPDTTYRFLLSYAIIAQVVERTGLPIATVRRALQANDTPAVRCKVAIALREIGLAAPDDIALPLLGDLQPLIAHDPLVVR